MIERGALTGMAGVAIVALLSLASACQSGAPAAARVDRVVMVSYDGVGADLAHHWINSGVATDRNGLAAMALHGVVAERLRMVDPTLTAVNHTALVTGEPPAATGIVSNGFRRPGRPIITRASGFSTSSESSPLWLLARRQGVRAGTLLWPGADAGALDRVGDFGVLWPGPALAESEIVELDPATAATRDDLPSRDGVQVLWWTLELGLPEAQPRVFRFELAVLDGTRDGRPRYDRLAFRPAGGVEWRMVGEREWFERVFKARATSDLGRSPYAVWSKALHLDRFGGAVRLYRGAAWRLKAYPDPFEERLTQAVGPWPGLPDQDLIADWWLDAAQGIDLDTYLEQIERLDRYLDDIARWVIETEDFGLLLAYHPASDEYQHSSLISEPEQWGYSPGKAVAAREGLKRVGRSVDASVAVLWQSLDPERDVLVVVSDHGQVPLHDLVRLDRVLAEAGLVELAADGRVAASTPMATALHSGSAHLYLNLEGREPTGVVDPIQAEDLLRRAARLLADLNREGEPIVEKVFTRSEAAAIGLDHPASGDLIAFLRPGFAFAHGIGEAVIEPARYYGQHGYLAHHDAMCGMLLARGAAVKPGRRGELRVTEVAPMIAAWLGLPPPAEPLKTAGGRGTARTRRNQGHAR
jgi:predicted AlkP superfamily phosphohydrolase/phosphomutase